MTRRQSTDASGYVHKFRLEAHEGAYVSIESGPPQARMRSVWFLLKLIGSVGVASSLLFAVLHLAG